MIDQFKNLTDDEVDLMMKAPVLVCILIAGADGTIDKQEINEAIAVMRSHKRSASVLAPYSKVVYEDLEDKVMILIQSYPYESTQRIPLLVSELAGLNAILPKLDKTFAIAFYTVLRGLARKIAKSSGGLFGIHSVGREEAKYIDLPMINNPA